MEVLAYFKRQIERVKNDNAPLKSAQVLLKELNSLEGLNVEERERAVCVTAA